MTRRAGSIGRDYFDALYAADPDPWRFASSDYEAGKYAASLAALPPRRFADALEVGCSIGIFTNQLAARCDRLLALDVADAALAQARANCQAGHVTFENRRVPAEWPAGGPFDLIVLSEVLYYLAEADIARLAGLVRDSLLPDGVVLMVHYLGETDYPVSGDAATEIFLAAAGLRVLRQEREALYRIDVGSSSFLQKRTKKLLSV